MTRRAVVHSGAAFAFLLGLAMAAPAESGLPGFEFHSWYGLWGPANLPPPVVARLNAEVTRWLSLAEVRKQFDQLGYETQLGSAEDFARFVREDSQRSAKIIRDAGIKAE